MSEQVPQVRHSELHNAIDDAAIAAQEASKRYHYEGSDKASDESILSSNALGGDPISTSINRSSHPWFKDRTDTRVHAQKPSELGEDPYHHAGTDYESTIKNQLGAKTKIERRNAKGEVVYTHESDDLQLARRLGVFAAKVSARQNRERADYLRKVA